MLDTSLIIELVNSICRDIADSKLTSLYNNVLLIALKSFYDQQDSYWHEIGIMKGSSHLSL